LYLPSQSTFNKIEKYFYTLLLSQSNFLSNRTKQDSLMLALASLMPAQPSGPWNNLITFFSNQENKPMTVKTNGIILSGN
jgi:hypothetical protein